MPHLAKNSTSSSSDVFADTTSPSSLDDFPSRVKSLSAQPGSLSPAVQGFDFSPRDHDQDLDDIDAAVAPDHNLATSPPMKDQDWDAQSIRSTKSTRSVKSLKAWRTKSASTKDESRRKTQFFEDQFAYKEGWDSHAVDQARTLSPVVAELRTNVIIKDEYSLVTELSGHFATRYQRAESAIMISIAHSQCLMFGGTFEPAYILTISAVESHCQSATNKRNAVVIQTFLTDVLGVSGQRGIVRFNPIREDCLATSGHTVSGEIDKLDADNGGGLKKALTASRRKSHAPSMKRRGTTASEVGVAPAETTSKNRKASNADRRRSFMSLGGRKSPTEQKEKEKEKQKKHRVSLHPPNIEELQGHGSGSSSPEMPAPVFISTNGLNPPRRSSMQPSALQSRKADPADDTRGLLSEASRKLSAIDANAQPRSPRPSPQLQAQPHMSVLPPPSPGYTNHSRPTSRSRTPGSHPQTPTQQTTHVSQLLQSPTQAKHGQHPPRLSSQIQHLQRRQSESPHRSQQQQQQQQSAARPQSVARKSMSHQQLRKPLPLQPQAGLQRQMSSPLQQSNGLQNRPAPTPVPALKANFPAPPAIPDDKPMPAKMSKRKSLIQMFRSKS